MYFFLYIKNIKVSLTHPNYKQEEQVIKNINLLVHIHLHPLINTSDLLFTTERRKHLT